MDNTPDGISVGNVIATLAFLVVALSGLALRLFERRLTKLEGDNEAIADLKVKVATLWQEFLGKIKEKAKSKSTGA